MKVAEQKVKSVTEYLDTEYLSYAKYVVENRAIPSVIDGLANRIDQLKRYKSEESDISPSDYGLTHWIESQFDREMTPTQFELFKTRLEKLLQEAADKVSKVKPNKKSVS
jgi:hypothetical protein